MRNTIVIGINGPVGIGKTWLADHIEGFFPHSVRKGPRDFIWDAFAKRHGITSSPEDYKRRNPELYRKGMIDLAKEGRAKDPQYWSRPMLEFLGEAYTPVVINDSLAFPEEHDFLLNRIKNFVTIVVAPPNYRVGSLYDDAYRACVEPVGGFRAYTSSSALQIFAKRIENAQQHLEAGNLTGVAVLLGLDEDQGNLSR